MVCLPLTSATASATAACVGLHTQVFIPVAQGALSHGALRVIRPALGLAASRLLHALATTEASTVLRNARRFCRALVQVRSFTGGGLRGLV